MTTPSNNGQVAKPFRDDQCVAIMALPGYSVTDCLILLWIAKHEYFGQSTCTALPATIALEMGGKITVRTVQRRLKAFEDDALVKCLKSTRGVFAIREMSLTPKFWALVQGELAKVNPKRYGDANHASVKRHPVRLETDSQTTSGALQTTPMSFAPTLQTTSGASQTTPGALAPTMVEPARVPAFETANTESSVVNSREETTTTTIAARGEEDPEEKTRGTIDDVCDTIRRCTHIPNDWADKIRENTGLAHRIKGDWYSLLLAVTRLDDKVRAKDVNVKKIDNPVNYLLGVVREIPTLPPGEVEGLKQKIQRVQDKAPQEASERGPGSWEHGFRQEVGRWYQKAKTTGVPDAEILPKILAHIDRHGAANRYTAKMIELREDLAADEVQRLEASA